MDIEEFRRIATTFAESPASVELSKGLVVLQLGDEVIEASVFRNEGILRVREMEQTYTAPQWIAKRLARLPLLAERIRSYVPETPHFVKPSGEFLDQLETATSQNDTPVRCADAASTAYHVLGRQSAGATSVLYLTSDAGEGKTTLINQMAREQALAYKEKRASWLLVPIPLGGRAFLRFDDVVVAALMNRLRFQRLYYDAFIELVRIGFIVPAFDGFEEMFVEGAGAEAPSALGNLVRTLRSQGTVLIAARKAYFEYQSFRTQARLFDAIGKDSVSFARLALERWTKDQFVAYGRSRKSRDPLALYEIVLRRFGDPKHPLLSRAVLVKRLFDVADKAEDLKRLVESLGSKPRDYFYQFVNAIVEREAQEKWLDKVGDPQMPLLSMDEHHELLALVAQEMWLGATNALTGEFMDAIAEMFCESKAKTPSVTRQVKERLKQHSLIIAANTTGTAYSFDHEDFQQFFLGESLGWAVVRKSEADIRAIITTASLPAVTCDEVVESISRREIPRDQVIQQLLHIAGTESPTSFAKENCGALFVRLADGIAVARTIGVTGITFTSDALMGRILSNISFQGCNFLPTSLAHGTLERCHFKDCRFDRIELSSNTTISDVQLEDCKVDAIYLPERNEQLYDPGSIERTLADFGFRVPVPVPQVAPREIDQRVRLVEKFLRIFLRSTHVNQSVIQLRFGASFSHFFDDVLPILIHAGIVEEIQYIGRGSQRRFRLQVPLQRLHEALENCEGSFDLFVSLARAG